MATEAVTAELGTLAPDFFLPGACGQYWSRGDVAGPHGLLVMFICNHCPYVQAILDRIVRDALELQAMGYGVAAISSNDADAYPDDSFDAMRRLWRDRRLPFPYLYDADQSVARAYGAACTPDFYGYDRDLRLQYHGRLDASGRQPAPPGARRELMEAMKHLRTTGRPVCADRWVGGSGVFYLLAR